MIDFGEMMRWQDGEPDIMHEFVLSRAICGLREVGLNFSGVVYSANDIVLRLTIGKTGREKKGVTNGHASNDSRYHWSLYILSHSSTGVKSWNGDGHGKDRPFYFGLTPLTYH
jgi:hypothetical protein